MTIPNTILLQSQGGGMSSILMIVAMVVIFYFFMIRPQQKQRKELKKQRDAMAPGSKAITSGGIHGVLREINDQTVLLEVDKGVVLKISKESIYPLIEDNSKGGKKNNSADKGSSKEKSSANLEKNAE